jgi:uncharacterized protein (DUF433 family)/DNA-binding transcriptional MerR regulator
MGEVIRMPPRGRYLASEAGQLAGVSGQTIGQWARRGYIRSSVSDSRPRIYSFPDVAEAMVVHELLDRGVPHKAIRTAIAALGEQFGDWPLTDAPLATEAGEGRARMVLQELESFYDVGDRGWQQLLEPAHLNEVRAQLRRGGWAVRTLPDLDHIEVDPDRLGGRPTIRGRRIAAEDVARIADESGVDVLVEDYELSEREVADARRWWSEVRRLEAAA